MTGGIKPSCSHYITYIQSSLSIFNHAHSHRKKKHLEIYMLLEVTRSSLMAPSTVGQWASATSNWLNRGHEQSLTGCTEDIKDL